MAARSCFLYPLFSLFVQRFSFFFGRHRIRCGYFAIADLKLGLQNQEMDVGSRHPWRRRRRVRGYNVLGASVGAKSYDCLGIITSKRENGLFCCFL